MEVYGNEKSVCLLRREGRILYIRVGLANDLLRFGRVISGIGIGPGGLNGMGVRRRYGEEKVSKSRGGKRKGRPKFVI